MRLRMLVILIEFQMVGRFESTANPKSRFAFVPGDTEEFKFNQNLDLDSYCEIQRNLSFSISTRWLKSPHHSGFRLGFRRAFEVSIFQKGLYPQAQIEITFISFQRRTPQRKKERNLSEFWPCSPTRSKDNPLQRCSKFSLVPVFYPSTKLHSCVLLSSLPLSLLMDPKSPSHPDICTAHVSSFHDYICGSWCLSVHWPSMVGQFSYERKPLEGKADPRRVSSESDRFSSRQECEASIWSLVDGPVSFSDGVCAFLGNGPSLFWLGKSKPFMSWSRKN